MFTDKFKEVISHEGVVSIVTWFDNNVNISNTWNSYLVVPEDGCIFIPAAGMNKTEANIKNNSRVKMSFGSKEVKGLWGDGAGFLAEGVAEFIYEGSDYEMMKQKYPFMKRVLAIKIDKLIQTV